MYIYIYKYIYIPSSYFDLQNILVLLTVLAGSIHKLAQNPHDFI